MPSAESWAKQKLDSHMGNMAAELEGLQPLASIVGKCMVQVAMLKRLLNGDTLDGSDAKHIWKNMEPAQYRSQLGFLREKGVVRKMIEAFLSGNREHLESINLPEGTLQVAETPNDVDSAA